jgi:predicted transposase/invertase (TIGR01784 family)
MASEVLMTISRDEVERARLVSEYKYELDTQSKVVQAKREGIQEGIQEGIRKGIQQGIRDIAVKMKRRGVSIDQIAEDTGLSPEEIAGL